MPSHQSRIIMITTASQQLICLAAGYNRCKRDGWHLQVPASILHTRVQQAVPRVWRSCLQAQGSHSGSGDNCDYIHIPFRKLSSSSSLAATSSSIDVSARVGHAVTNQLHSSLFSCKSLSYLSQILFVYLPSLGLPILSLISPLVVYMSS